MNKKVYQVLLGILAALPLPALSAVANDKLNALDEVLNLHESSVSGDEAGINGVVEGLRSRNLIDRDVRNAPPPDPSHRG